MAKRAIENQPTWQYPITPPEHNLQIFLVGKIGQLLLKLLIDGVEPALDIAYDVLVLHQNRDAHQSTHETRREDPPLGDGELPDPAIQGQQESGLTDEIGSYVFEQPAFFGPSQLIIDATEDAMDSQKSVEVGLSLDDAEN